MSEVVERVAKAICAAQGYPDGDFIAEARTAIEAMRESHPDMDNAAWPLLLSEEGASPGRIWRAMIDAALSPSREDEGK